MENCFVFAVCGSREHIDTLNYSLRALRKFTSVPIVVVTEHNRNEGTIEHSRIINHTTPAEMNHHQASIYLKTSLHRILPIGPNYCYLDSDVVAVSEEAAQVFNHQYNSITFAPDHCTMNKFSPMAVNCNCISRFRDLVDKVEDMRTEYDRNYEERKRITTALEEVWKSRVQDLTTNRIANLTYAVKHFLLPRIVWLDKDFYLDKKANCWYFKNGHALNYDYDLFGHIEQALNIIWDAGSNCWRTKEGFNIYLSECNHLHKAIEDMFGIKVTEVNWQHWNGGVFLFNKQSHDFMDTWHQYTLKIFKSPYWKTRDQGTLIATAWKYGLEFANPLIKEFNFIADPNNLGAKIMNESTLSDNHGKTTIKPAFVHLYHGFGDIESPFWRWTDAKVKLQIANESF